MTYKTTYNYGWSKSHEDGEYRRGSNFWPATDDTDSGPPLNVTTIPVLVSDSEGSKIVIL